MRCPTQISPIRPEAELLADQNEVAETISDFTPRESSPTGNGSLIPTASTFPNDSWESNLNEEIWGWKNQADGYHG
jgi:hypothetical protein